MPVRGRIGQCLAGCLLPLLALLALSATPLEAQRRGFSLPGLDGGSLQPSDLDQGVHLVVVWASWSPRGKDIVARVNALVDRWGGEAQVIMVDFQEDRETVQSFLEGKQRKAPVYLDLDGSLSKRYAVTHLPGLVVLEDGKTRFSGRLTRTSDDIIAQALE